MTKLIFLLLLALTLMGCQTQKSAKSNSDSTFSQFETDFLDAYWKQYPSYSIFIGYGKYYENLVIPDSASVAGSVAFTKLWLDSLSAMDYAGLNNNNKISFNIIKNQLESDNWYLTVFKAHEWNASNYNLSAECDYIINQPYAPLDDRLRILSQHLQNSASYYQAATKMLHNPVKEYIELAIKQNQAGLAVFGTSLTDSVKASGLSDDEKTTLNKNIENTITAMNGFVKELQAILADKKTAYRDFRIGKELFNEKFKYDLAVDITPEQLYQKAIAEKKMFTEKMFVIADSLWAVYCDKQAKPADTLALIQKVIDKISLQHATPENLYATLSQQVDDLLKFIVEKDLFDYDTTIPIKVRYMPEYARGVTVASAEFVPPYQKGGETWYNIDDLTLYPKDKAESVLREYNNYTSQLLSIHEAVPGHCLQGIYNNKKSPDILRSVFQNGAMIEGWAVYVEEMMLENGWGNNSPELWLMHYKMNLRMLANVIIDYEIQCLNAPKERIMNLLVKECFQTQAQAEEKYHRAQVSQVQLCSYFAGAYAIAALRDDYKKKMGEAYSLKDFHEKFLSFGSSPVKYIRERMLE